MIAAYSCMYGTRALHIVSIVVRTRRYVRARMLEGKPMERLVFK